MDAMTPTEAARALAGLEDFEEAVTTRTAGMTQMLWGLVVAGIFLSYGAASPAIEGLGAWWLYAVLWVPWTVAGTVLTRSLWHAHAVTLRREPSRGGWQGVLVSLAIVALGALLWVGAEAAGGLWSVSSAMLFVSGLFAVLSTRLHGEGGLPLVVGGLVMVGTALAMGLTGLAEEAANLIAAGIAGTGWFVPGLLLMRRG